MLFMKIWSLFTLRKDESFNIFMRSRLRVADVVQRRRKCHGARGVLMLLSRAHAGGYHVL